MNIFLQHRFTSLNYCRHDSRYSSACAAFRLLHDSRQLLRCVEQVDRCWPTARGILTLTSAVPWAVMDVGAAVQIGMYSRKLAWQRAHTW